MTLKLICEKCAAIKFGSYFLSFSHTQPNLFNNPFVLNASFLYLLKTSENRKGPQNCVYKEGLYSTFEWVIKFGRLGNFLKFSAWEKIWITAKNSVFEFPFTKIKWTWNQLFWHINLMPLPILWRNRKELIWSLFDNCIKETLIKDTSNKYR